MGFFKSILEKVKSGLAKTRQQFATGVRSILKGKVLTPELIDQLRQRMIQADIGVKTTTELIKDIQAGLERGEITTGDQALDFLKEQLNLYWPAENRKLNFAPPGTGPTVILVVGINGSGKTTSIAKIAKSLRDEGKTVMLAACDTFRAAAVEQLEVWSKRLGVEVVKGKQGGDPAAVAFDACEAAKARGVDVLIVDTAGRLHTQDHLMRQLSKIRGVIEKRCPPGPGSPGTPGGPTTVDNSAPTRGASPAANREAPGTPGSAAPHEVILVLDATVGQNAIQQAKVFSEATQVTGIFLAKLDGTAKGGIVVAIREALNIPVKFIGVGETPDDVEPFDPAKFVEAMFAE